MFKRIIFIFVLLFFVMPVCSAAPVPISVCDEKVDGFVQRMEEFILSFKKLNAGRGPWLNRMGFNGRNNYMVAIGTTSRDSCMVHIYPNGDGSVEKVLLARVSGNKNSIVNMGYAFACVTNALSLTIDEVRNLSKEPSVKDENGGSCAVYSSAQRRYIIFSYTMDDYGKDFMLFQSVDAR